MRHLGSIVLSLILAPVIYLLIGIGVVDATESSLLAVIHHDYPKVTAAIVALLAAALLYSLLVLTRISPLGPALSGLAFLVVSVWVLFAASSFVRLMPAKVPGLDGPVAIAAAGPVTLMLAVPLLLTMLSPSRWRHASATASPPATPGVYPPPPGFEPSFAPPPPYRPSRATDGGSQPLDPTRPLFPPPLTPPVMQPPVSPAPAPFPVDSIDPDAPTHRFGT